MPVRMLSNSSTWASLVAPKYIRATFTGLLLASASSSWADSSSITIEAADAWVIEAESPEYTLEASPNASDGVFIDSWIDK